MGRRPQDPQAGSLWGLGEHSHALENGAEAVDSFALWWFEPRRKQGDLVEGAPQNESVVRR